MYQYDSKGKMQSEKSKANISATDKNHTQIETKIPVQTKSLFSPSFNKENSGENPSLNYASRPVQLSPIMSTSSLQTQLIPKQEHREIQPLPMTLNEGQKRLAPRFTKMNNTGIPLQMKERFENLSGFSFDDVRVHYNSDKPIQLQASAYTQGNQVYIAPGQETHLGHELGHVIQQKQGRVHPTAKLGKAQINNNQELEREATNIGNSFWGYIGHTQKSLTRAPENSVIQRSEIELSNAGKFKDIGFVLQDNEADGVRNIGAKIIIMFTPDPSLGDEGDIVSLIQTVKDTTYKKTNSSGTKTLSWAAQIDALPRLRGASEDDYIIDHIITERDDGVADPVYVEPTGKVKDSQTATARLKRKFVNLDPRYTEKRMDELDVSRRTQKSIVSKLIASYTTDENSLDSFPELKGVLTESVGKDDRPKFIAEKLNSNAIYGATYSAIKTDSGWTPARLSDEPLFPVKKTPDYFVGGGMEFEVAAFFEPHTGSASYLGTIRWGWKIDSEKKISEATISLIDMALVAERSTSSKFITAVARWNAMSSDDMKKSPLQLPIPAQQNIVDTGQS